MLGTAGYMSPEQARREPVDKRTDVWAWGCVLYEMLTGVRAFEGQTSLTTLAKVAGVDPDWTKLPDATPGAVRSLLIRCLQKHPARRLHSIADARILLDETSSDEPRAAADIAMSSGTARALFLMIQCGYLAMYAAALYHMAAVGDALATLNLEPVTITLPLVIVTAMSGIAVRLFLLSSVGLSHPDAERKFRRLFPVLLILDALWAMSPLLAIRRIGPGIALAGAAALAYLPFSQRTLIRRIYRVLRGA